MNNQSLRLLLLEDDPGDARLIQEHLRDAMEGQFNCTLASTVGEMVEELRTSQFDAILMDLNLPDGHGLETFLNTQSQARSTPILIVTGLDDQALAVQAARAGAQDYIVKGQIASSALARAIRYAIERHRLQTELQSLSLTDSLTGLYNRRGFLTLAEEQLRLLHRSPHGLLVFLCDVDGMKAVNDTFGHHEGDQNLLSMVAVLRATFRASDLIARLGGDELAIMAIGTLPATAEMLQARLQVNLNRYNARLTRPYPLSFSTGVSYVAPGDQITMEELLSKADQEMYVQKRARQKARTV